LYKMPVFERKEVNMKREQEKFYSLQLACPHCEEDLEIVDVEFSLSGAIKMELVCTGCEKPIDLISSWDRIMCICAQAEQDQKEIKKVVVLPLTSRVQ